MTVADRVAIRELVDCYADAVNRRNADDWESLWHPEGVWELMGVRAEGSANARAMWERNMATFPWVLHLVHSGVIELSAAGASARWYVTEHVKTGANAMTVMGCYQDRYAQVGGAWRFRERRFGVLYQGPADLSGMTQQVKVEAKS